MFIELKKLRLSPTLLTILATVFTCGITPAAKAEQRLANPRSNKVIVSNGASLLGKIKPIQIAQNSEPKLPEGDDAEVSPDIKLPEFDPSEAEIPENGNVEIKPEVEQEEGDREQSANEPRVLVAEVVVNGANEELKDIVYATVGTEPGRTTTRTQLQEDVNAVYATGFFQNVEVTPGDTSLGVRITFDVEPNPILKGVNVETISQSGKSDVLPAKKVNEFFGSNYNRILNLRDLQQGIIKVNEWYSQNGYQLAQVVGAPQVTPEGNVTLVVAEGIIEDIKVRYFDEDDEPIEDGRTREFIVTREVQLAPGDVFNRETAGRDLQRIYGLGIFEDARFSFSPGEDPSKVVVNIDVVEGSSGSIAAGAGFSSDSGLFGTASYQQKNFGGNNQTLGTEIQVGDDSLLFDVNFTDPWIAGSKSRTSYTVNAFRRRSISLVFNGDDDIDTLDLTPGDGDDDSNSPRIVRTGGGINFARPLPADPFKRRDWTLSTGLKYQRVEVKDADGDLAPLSQDTDSSDGVNDSFNLAGGDDGTDDLVSLNFGATRDRRNNPLQPTKGSLLRVGTEQTVPVDGIFFNRLRANYSQYLPINIIPFGGNTEALAFNIQAGTIIGEAPPYEAFILGGSNSVRGFGDGEVGSGKSFFQATGEYRFPIFKIVGGALFFDYGTTLGSDDNVEGSPSVLRGLPGSGYGYGLGVRVQSPLGPIRVDYAINDDGDSEIQFGIGEKF